MYYNFLDTWTVGPDDRRVMRNLEKPERLSRPALLQWPAAKGGYISLAAKEVEVVLTTASAPA